MSYTGRSLSIIILLFLLSPVTRCIAQQLPFYDSGELMKEGLTAYENGNWEKARECYNKVPEGDTNYLWSRYELSLTCLQDSSYEECITLCKAGLRKGNTEQRQLLLNMGAAYNELGQETVAQQLYDSVARLYPHDYQPYYEKAVIAFKKERYPEAEQLLRGSLLRHPYHFRSHYLLGNIYALEGRLTEAFIALQTSLICTNERSQAQGPIGLLSSLAVQTDEVSNLYSNKKPEYAHPLFDEIDEIVHAKLALDKGYRLKTPIDDNIIRQLQVIMEKVAYDEKDSNFVMQYYVPLLQEVYGKELFDPYVLLLFSEYGITAIDKMAEARKGKAKLEDIRKIVFPYLNTILGTRTLNYGKRKTLPEIYTYYPSEKTLVVGLYADKESRKFAEGPVQYYEDQVLAAEGHYNAAGKKTGEWRYYYRSGTLRMKEEYRDGVLNGHAALWYGNGVMSREAVMKDGIEQEVTDYAYNGSLTSRSLLKGENEYAVTYYNPDGSLMRVLNLSGGKPKDGAANVLFPGGQVSKEISYRNGQLDGPFKSYFDDGVLMESYRYKEGKIDGLYESFYHNGKPENKYHYAAGNKEGAAEEYDEEGRLSQSKSFHNDDPDGTTSFYDKQGKVFGTVTFRDNLAVAVKFTGPDGKTVREEENSKGISPLEYYNEQGVKKTSLNLDSKGKVQGKSSYFDAAGMLTDEIGYKDDRQDGAAVNYYKNGKVNYTRTYKEGMPDGYCRSFYSSGQLKAEGWQKNGDGQGTWHNYWPNGQLQRDYFLIDDEPNGPEKNYEMNGKPDYTNLYDHGMITGLIQYDSTGRVIQDISFDKGKGQYRTLYPNGNTAMECALVNGRFQGPYTIHSPGKKILEQGNYAQGKRAGEFVTCYPNGKPRLKGRYKNDQREGSWIAYAADGTIESETGYRDGQLEGVDKFYSNGMLRYETHYHQDKKDGAVTIYGENNARAGVLYYKEGALTGYTYEGADGNLLPVTAVTKGTAVIRTLYAGGAKALEFNFVHNCYEGSQKLYYSNGRLAEDRNFTGDDYEGSYTRFNPDGSKALEGQYSKDMQQGKGSRYDKTGKLILSVTMVDDIAHGPATITDENGKGMMNLSYYYGTLQ